MKKILVVDDSSSIRKLVTMALDDDYDISEAEDGRDGLQSAMRVSYDLIISDVNMNDIGGYEMVKQLRTKDSYKSVPIIMLTTESSDDSKSRGRDAGATGWIIKPFSPDKLKIIVDRLT